MKRFLVMPLIITVILGFAVSASAADYDFGAPEPYDYAKPTSVEVVYTADGGAAPNVDRSKNTALIPPAFGSASAYAPVISAAYPAIYDTPVSYDSIAYPTMKYTAVTNESYYSGGYLGTLKIPSLGVSAKIYQGTETSDLAKGIGHFEETSIWDGNVALAAHNRGTNSYFGQIHTLKAGDKITLTTKNGTRTYSVTSVAKVSETDRSSLEATSENVLTLYTCVRDERDYRWCVRAVEII